MKDWVVLKKQISKVLDMQGVPEKNLTIVAATKTRSIDEIKLLPENGIFVCGENKVQELLSKYQVVPQLSWHFIGQLQSNKVKFVVDKVDMIHSLDRLSLAKEIDKECKKANKTMHCLIEVNVSQIESRGGVAPKEVSVFFEQLKSFENIKVCGLMTVLPIAQEDVVEKHCRQMKELCVKLGLPILSMGMSQDWQIALANGSNMLRLGTILFGKRGQL